MKEAVSVQVRDGLAVVRIHRRHGNAINDQVVDGLMAACQSLDPDPAVRGVLLAAEGRLFSPGLDIRELIACSRPEMSRFITRFGACVLMLYTLRKPLVAAIHGHAVAGGFVLTLTADRRILKRGARVGLNEIRVGVPLPFGVALILRESVSGAHLEEVALFGRNYTDEEAVQAGLVHEVSDAADFEAHCLSRLGELASRQPLALATTKRYLRAATVERVRAHDARFTGEFLDAWFAPTTQERLRGLIEELDRHEASSSPADEARG